MSTNEGLSSNLSESNSVLELPTTYSLPNVGDQLMSDEDIASKHSDSIGITSASATPIINTDSSPSNSEDCNSSIGVAELHTNTEGEHRHINIAQIMEHFYQDAGERKLESDPVSEQIAHLLTSKISQLKEKGGGQYLLRSFQMALVLLSRHGANIFKIGNCRGGHFSSSVNSAEFSSLPGLSKDVVCFIQQEISKSANTMI